MHRKCTNARKKEKDNHPHLLCGSHLSPPPIDGGEQVAGASSRHVGDVIKRAHARRLLDEMPPGSDAARSKMAAAAGGGDRLSALGDSALHRVLSFLPSSEAVETSLLSRRWRHVWRSARSLRVNGADDPYYYRSANDLNKFVNSLLLFRDSSPVDVVEIDSYKTEDSGKDSDEALRYLELWIRYGLSKEARVLRVCNNTGGDRWIMRAELIISEHLRVLELSNVNLEASCLDFSGCKSLKKLRMKHCDIDASRIISPSVQHLSLTFCHFDHDNRSQISAPNLIMLELADFYGRTPFLQSMPSLVSAFVRLQTSVDSCNYKYETGDCGKCSGCHPTNVGDSSSILFEGLSNSTNLELTSAQEEFIFRKDLTQCPVFSKLKTLLINEWCVTASLGALISFLQHSPSLEKLILQFPEGFEELVEAGATYDTTKDPFTLKHLTVEVKCCEVNDSIRRILDLLDSYGVPFEQIKVQPPPQLISLDDFEGPWPSAGFSFEQQKTSWAVDEANSSDNSSESSEYTD